MYDASYTIHSLGVSNVAVQSLKNASLSPGASDLFGVSADEDELEQERKQAQQRFLSALSPAAMNLIGVGGASPRSMGVGAGL